MPNEASPEPKGYGLVLRLLRLPEDEMQRVIKRAPVPSMPAFLHLEAASKSQNIGLRSAHWCG
jgi:hypothetical protein